MNWVGQETDYFKISDVAGYYLKMFFFGLAENQVFARVMKWIINTQIQHQVLLQWFLSVFSHF